MATYVGRVLSILNPLGCGKTADVGSAVLTSESTASCLRRLYQEADVPTLPESKSWIIETIHGR
jgi:hypothetical protein